jgi:hypothetical protein
MPMFHRKPLGEPNPQAPNLALAVVLLVVVAVQAIFNAWQGATVTPSSIASTSLTNMDRLFYWPCHGFYLRHVTYRYSRHT